LGCDLPVVGNHRRLSSQSGGYLCRFPQRDSAALARHAHHRLEGEGRCNPWPLPLLATPAMVQVASELPWMLSRLRLRKVAYPMRNSAISAMTQGQRVFCPGGARPPMEAMIRFVDAYCAQDLVGLAQPAVLPLQRLDALALVSGRAGAAGPGRTRPTEPSSTGSAPCSRSWPRSRRSQPIAMCAPRDAPTPSAPGAHAPRPRTSGTSCDSP
jgi:hypothetical protein